MNAVYSTGAKASVHAVAETDAVLCKCMSRPGAGWSDTEWIKRRAGSDGRVRDLTRVHSQRSPTLAYKRTYNSAFVISVFNNNTYKSVVSFWLALLDLIGLCRRYIFTAADRLSRENILVTPAQCAAKYIACTRSLVVRCL